jgi:DNA-binding Lrp family transcriptional regulator
MELTPRDAEILRLLRRHRFLRSNHIAALLGDSRQQLLRRLQKLYHHGYVERPPCQLDYFHRGGSLAMVYGLGNRGAAFLLRTENSTPIRLDWNARNRSATRLFLDHALMISEILVALETACRARGDVRLRHAEELAHSARGDTARWSIPTRGMERTAVIPDAVFALERTQPDGSTDSVLYCLEADRGTMPVQSANEHRTSIARKLTAYETSWRTNIFRQRFNATRVQVLTVTTSAARLDSITACAGNRVSAAGLFHFTAFTDILVSSAQFLDSLLMRHVHSLPPSDIGFSGRTAT